MVTVGSTLLTLTVVEYSVKPPSLSMIRPLTVYVPLLGNVQLVDAVPPEPAYVAPERSPFVLLKVIVAGLPSATGPLLESVAVGATLVTVIVLLSEPVPPSLSVTDRLTI